MTLQIFNRGGQKFSKATQCLIAKTAQQAAHFAGCVIVVYRQRKTLYLRLATYCAQMTLRLQHHFIFSQRNAVLPTEPRIFVRPVTSSFIRLSFKSTALFTDMRQEIASRGACFTLIGQSGWSCFVRPKLRGVFNGFAALTPLFGNLRLWCTPTPEHITSINSPCTFNAKAHQSIFTSTIFPKFSDRLFRLTFTANFGRWYGGLSHAVRTSITNDVIRLVREFAALVRADPILSRFSRNLNNFTVLCVCAAAAAHMNTISSSEKGEALCLS
jgi:hypothetical protein